jgi:uncharacterized protein (TIGR02145 family)
MKHIFTITLCFLALSLSAQETITYPYNPDIDADQIIQLEDLLEILVIYGNAFELGEIMVDDQTLTEYLTNLNLLIEAIAMPDGTETGQFLRWDGLSWVPVIPSVGCIDPDACNYDATASILDEDKCLYQDACGVCDGPGEIYGCGCADIPENDCDCEGNQLDALNVCGGECSADEDGDGICDDGDSCVGEADECGVCNGPGAIYDCGCSGIAEGECDCEGTPDIDLDGICDTEDSCIGLDDTDGDGICDNIDDCIGQYDLCGLCNGPGPIYECGCFDIAEGTCDCAGNLIDEFGNCQDCLVDSDGSGIIDSICSPCLGQAFELYQGELYELVAIGDHCWFKDNLKALLMRSGDNLEQFSPELLGLADTPGVAFGVDSSVYYNGWAVSALFGEFNPESLTNYDYSNSLCPTYWRVPNEQDWSELFEHVDGNGGELKQAGTESWNLPNVGATNSTGFNALPKGEILAGNSIQGFGNLSSFWGFSELDLLPSVSLYSSSIEILQASQSKSRGKSIRCVREANVFGCTNSDFIEYDPVSNVNDGSCITPAIPGCTDPEFEEFMGNANVDDGSCLNLMGCNQSDVLTYDGYDHQLITINGKCWLAENLRASHYANGDTIIEVQDPYEWQALGDPPLGAWSVYNNLDSLGNVYGYLYNNYAVTDIRGLCPGGWHVPSKEDIENLQEYTGGLDAGLFLKSDSSFPGWDGTDYFAFNALPGGKRGQDGGFGSFGGINSSAQWWTSTTSGGKWYYRMESGNDNVIIDKHYLYSYYFIDRDGMYVRCLRD